MKSDEKRHSFRAVKLITPDSPLANPLKRIAKRSPTGRLSDEARIEFHAFCRRQIKTGPKSSPLSRSAVFMRSPRASAVRKRRTACSRSSGGEADGGLPGSHRASCISQLRRRGRRRSTRQPQSLLHILQSLLHRSRSSGGEADGGLPGSHRASCI